MTRLAGGSNSHSNAQGAAAASEPPAATEGYSGLQRMDLTSFGLPTQGAGGGSGEGGPPAGAVAAMAHRTPPEALPEVPLGEGGEAMRQQLRGADLTGWGLPPGGSTSSSSNGGGSSMSGGAGAGETGGAAAGSGGVTGALGGIATAGIEAVDVGEQAQVQPQGGGGGVGHGLTGAYEAIRRTVQEGA
ncbi:hypothetical protein CHLRE_12g504450v5 [Chlamydomonas reinhardtii]|uniref:Uncharacterized protein n=1 Tax=Chlamydomonas reinhardtii TaxID=3055 RepID=A0A2K3D321_CHLRE|nr:uncharacterized protein CHLRE_12g504450v5 [Chlamydomonas reinhardtii]PNW74919.1 hypothetical protein CHLRE_12g504450v5 [Chlamydomonas reinhardtii]